jgi:hypothetical protein
VATPSFVAYLAEKAPEVLGIPASELGLRVVCGGGESGELPAFQREMERLWGTRHVYDWASASDAHPNVFAHCHVRDGKHHLTPDLVLVQLIDPASGEVKDIAEGAEGEYIVTHLDREACPLARYRTGDILRVRTSPCACGRTGFRMDIIGRPTTCSSCAASTFSDRDCKHRAHFCRRRRARRKSLPVRGPRSSRRCGAGGGGEGVIRPTRGARGRHRAQDTRRPDGHGAGRTGRFRRSRAHRGQDPLVVIELPAGGARDSRR